jgi:hypothetical protein
VDHRNQRRTQSGRLYEPRPALGLPAESEKITLMRRLRLGYGAEDGQAQWVQFGWVAVQAAYTLHVGLEV